MSKIGSNIKLLRKAKGVTQEELAEAVHVSFQAVSKWENGGAPDIDTLPALANFFGVSIDELMGFKLNALTSRERFVKFMAYHGISLSVATALALYNKYGITVNYCHDRKVEDGRGRGVCGHTLEDGERVIIVDDLINSGDTLIARIEKLRANADITIVAVVVIVERYEADMEAHHPNGADILREKYGAQVLSVVNGDDIAHAMKCGIV